MMMMEPTEATEPTTRADAPDSRNSLRHILAGEPAMDDSRGTPSQADTPAPDDRDQDHDQDRDQDQGHDHDHDHHHHHHHHHHDHDHDHHHHYHHHDLDHDHDHDLDLDLDLEEAKGAGDSDGARACYTSTTTTTRRNANGSVSSVYSGNKIKHLKKDDGIPLWRRDIQYDFLKLVFEDDRPVFTKQSDPQAGPAHTFADIYLDAMAKSSKCSKILKDKLLTERPAAVNMAMVCLLVNVGRMNTTLNFFPEMRAQLRTYHSIPSLQAHQDPNAYKQLQDAPRLKSILKGATEDQEQPSTVEDIMQASIPRTNPVNLIFVLSQYAPKISELHFFPPRDFFDLVMRSNLSSRSRATAFLWLMWWYLESDFSKEAAERNPFGPGQPGPTEDPLTAENPLKCPNFEILTPEAEALENVDTVEEQNFGEIKRKERMAILASDMAPVVTGPKRTNKKAFNQNPVFSVLADDGASTPGRDRQSPSHGSARGRGKLAKSIIERDYPSDTDHTRSMSPPGSAYNIGKKATPNMRINTLLNDDAPASSPAPKGPGRGNWARNRTTGGAGGGAVSGARSFKTRLDTGTSQDGQSPSTSAPTFNGPHGFYLPLNGSDPSHKRTRPLTQHQLAVEQYRRRRVDVILDRGIRIEYKAASHRRRTANTFMRAWIRCKGMADGYDTDEESHAQAQYQQDIEIGTKTPPPMPAGLVPLDFGGEINDHGEESYYRAKMLSRALRRLERWEDGRVTRRSRGVRNGMEERKRVYADDLEGEDEDDADEDMPDVDVEDLRREEESESSEEEEERYEAETLQPLMNMD